MCSTQGVVVWVPSVTVLVNSPLKVYIHVEAEVLR
jgi:hypothetical protein